MYKNCGRSLFQTYLFSWSIFYWRDRNVLLFERNFYILAWMLHGNHLPNHAVWTEVHYCKSIKTLSQTQLTRKVWHSSPLVFHPFVAKDGRSDVRASNLTKAQHCHQALWRLPRLLYEPSASLRYCSARLLPMVILISWSHCFCRTKQWIGLGDRSTWARNLSTRGGIQEEVNSTLKFCNESYEKIKSIFIEPAVHHEHILK